jgi:hypothetical protein
MHLTSRRTYAMSAARLGFCGGIVAILSFSALIALAARSAGNGVASAAGADQDIAPAGQRAQPQRWQYLFLSPSGDINRATEQLNLLAGDGWEYAGLFNTSTPGAWVFNPLNNRTEQAHDGHEAMLVLRRPKVIFKAPGAIEGESMRIDAKNGDFSLETQSMAPFILGHWSDDRQLVATPLKAGAGVKLVLPAPAAGTFRIAVNFCKASNYGIIQFYLNGKKIGEPIDGFHADTVVSSGEIELGVAELKEGPNSLGIEVVGANRMSMPPRFMWGLDYVLLKEARR